MQMLIRILLIWILLFGIAEARSVNVVVGGLPVTGGGAGGCETGTATVTANQEDPETGQSRSFNDWTIAQSFTATADPFYSVQINASGGGTVTCRLGTSIDLSSSYLDSVTITVGATQGWYEGVSTECPTLEVGTYYIVCSTADDQDVLWYIDDDPEYAGGQFYSSGTAHAFNGGTSVSTRDNLFRIYQRQ
jgi:hypothetical protein